MSKISFISFCIEYYAEYKHTTSDHVYRIFKKEGLLDVLEQDYEDLHGMGMEYLVHFCDEYLEGRGEE